MGIKVVKSGLLTTIQDLGRYGYQKEGVVVGGFMDSLSPRIGNMIVGNEENFAAIECTLIGPELIFTKTRLISITGADMCAKIDGQSIDMWRPIWINKGSVLSFGLCKKGCRSYISIGGGINVPKILGSRSTYTKANFGGWQGRAFKKADVIPLNETQNSNCKKYKWFFIPDIYSSLDENTIRVLQGPECDQFATNSKEEFTSTYYTISKESDRMGYSLTGKLLNLKIAKDMISSAVTFGTIQVTTNGTPIILMADHQTTGGYPRIAQVISVDLPKLAQLKIGSTIKFEWTTIEVAQKLFEKQENELKKLKQSLMFKHESI